MFIVETDSFSRNCRPQSFLRNLSPSANIWEMLRSMGGLSALGNFSFRIIFFTVVFPLLLCVFSSGANAQDNGVRIFIATSLTDVTARVVQGNEGNQGYGRWLYVKIELDKPTEKQVKMRACFSGTAKQNTTGEIKIGDTNDFAIYDLNRTSTPVLGSNCTRTVLIHKGFRYYPIADFRVIGDTYREGNETVKVTLEWVGAHDGFVFKQKTATYTILDEGSDMDQEPTPQQPVITISPGSSPITEGTAAGFTVNANPAPASAVNVSVEVSQSGDFVASSVRGTKTVTIPANQTSASYTVATINDSTDETDGSVTVSINSGSGYSVGNPATASVTVEDDDEIADNDIPRVTSIIRKAPSTSPTDANRLTWRVTFSEAVQNVDAGDFSITGTTAILMVATVQGTNSSYDITASGGDLAGLNATVTLRFARNQNIQDTSGNTLTNITPTGTNHNTFVVDNTPKLSLTPTVLSVREGTSRTYQVQLLGQADGDVTVEITGSWRDSNVSLDPTMFVLRDSNNKQTITVEAGEDEDKKNSEITLTHTAKIGSISIDSKAIELTIIDNDIPPSEVIKSGLLRFGRTIGDQSVVAVQDRLNALRSPGFVGTIAGHQPLQCHDDDQTCVQLDRVAFPENLSEEPTHTPSEDEILASTSFSHTKETTTGASITYWGQGVRSGFKGKDGELSLDGDVTGFMMGVDWSDYNRMYGLMLSRNKAEISYSNEASSGNMDMKLTAIVPYAGMNINDDLEIWGTLGFGSGELTRKEKDADDIITDISWRMVAFGTSGELPSQQIIPGADLRWSSDVLWTWTKADVVEDQLDEVSGKTLRKRLGVESIWEYQLATGALFRPSLEVGLRHDSGDAETGFGLDIGGGFEWNDPGRGLSVLVKGRKLVLHEKTDFDDWGVRLIAVYDPTPGTREGFSASISQQLGGVSPDEQGSLLKNDQLPGVNDTTQSDSWEAEIAYGISQGEGMVGTSYMSVEGQTEAETTRLGYRIQPDLTQTQNMSLDVWAEPGVASTKRTGDKDDKAGLKLTTLW